MTIAKVYGLKENPFEPTGAGVGKYPFVPPANFPILEQKIEEAGIEKKLYALLVNSPHGAGKSTTMEYLKVKATNGGYLSFRAPVILTRLTNLSIEDFVRDVLREAGPFGKVESLSQSKFGTTPSLLRKALVDTLSPIASRNKLMLWIVDEFDILADQPEKEQRFFLQFLRDVMDDLAKKDAPIAFIMSHTRYSSRQFEANLSKQHEPFRSRLVASLPLAYTFSEVKKIIFERLRSVAMSGRQEGDIFPFTEEALKSLYDLILSVRGTDSLDYFRLFERICHFALIEGAKRDMKKIDTALIQELFKEYGLKELPLREGRNLSLKTAQEIVTIKSSGLVQKNEAILQGIVRGISKNQSFGEGCVKNLQTSFMGYVGDGSVGINSMSADILRQDHSISILWVLASSKDGILQAKDIKDVMQELKPLLRDYEAYSHKVLFAYVSSIQIPNFPKEDFDEVIWIRDVLAEDLIGLSAGVNEDAGVLVKSFESDIAPMLSQLIIRETMDITTPLSAQAAETIQTLFVIASGGQVCTKEAIRQSHKRLFMKKTLIQERFISEAIQSGFVKEQTNQLEPSAPKAHIFLLDLLEKGPQEANSLLEKLGVAGEAIVNSALEFGLIYRDGGKISKRRLAEYENVVMPNLNSLKMDYKDEVIKESEIGKLIEWLISADENSKKAEQSYPRYIILTAIQKLAPSIEKEVKKYTETLPPISVSIPNPEPVTKPPSAVPPFVTIVPPANVSSTTTSVPVNLTDSIDAMIIQTLQKTGPLLIQEIDSQMKQQGYQQDIKGTVLRLIISGKLKVTSG